MFWSTFLHAPFRFAAYFKISQRSGSRLKALSLGTAIIWSGLSIGMFVSCGPQKQGSQSEIQIASMSQPEALADLIQIVETYRMQYGPLKYKETTLGLQFENMVSEAREAVSLAQTDAEYIYEYAKFLGKFRDGHVSFRAPVLTSLNELQAVIPLVLTPIEGRAIITSITDPSLRVTMVGLC